MTTFKAIFAFFLTGWIIVACMSFIIGVASHENCVNKPLRKVDVVFPGVPLGCMAGPSVKAAVMKAFSWLEEPL